MKQLITVFFIAMFSLALLAGCSDDTPAAQAETAKPSAQAAPAVPQKAPGKSGTVLDTMNVAGYTYVQVDTGTEIFWAAGPSVAVNAGDEVVVAQGQPMRNYHSKTLDRTFDMVYFVPSIQVAGAEEPTGDEPVNPAQNKQCTKVDTTAIDLSGIAPAQDGQTIADIFAGKADLADTPVKVRGKVVKFSPDIMDKNWVHIQDGTGAAGSNDLTVTTNAMVKKGDIVVVSGTLVIDKDFGYGYSYEVIIEDAEVTVE